LRGTNGVITRNSKTSTSTNEIKTISALSVYDLVISYSNQQGSSLTIIGGKGAADAKGGNQSGADTMSGSTSSWRHGTKGSDGAVGIFCNSCLINSKTVSIYGGNGGKGGNGGNGGNGGSGINYHDSVVNKYGVIISGGSAGVGGSHGQSYSNGETGNNGSSGHDGQSIVKI